MSTRTECKQRLEPYTHCSEAAAIGPIRGKHDIIHNILQSHQKTMKPQQPATSTENLVVCNFTVPELCKQTDKLTYRHRDMFITILRSPTEVQR